MDIKWEDDKVIGFIEQLDSRELIVFSKFYVRGNELILEIG